MLFLEEISTKTIKSVLQSFII